MVLRRTASSSTIISRYYSTRTTTKTNNLTTKVQNAFKKQIQPPPPPQRKSHIRFLSTNNSNKINNPNPKSPQEWAKENPQKARQILSVPPLLSSPFPKTTTQLETLNDYLSYRKWILPEDDDDDDDDEEEREMAIKLLSHPLTYPLTLASQIHHFLPQKDKKGKDDNDDEDEEEEEKERTIKLCCIGARAEATLPLDYWRESLILASALSTNYIPKKNKNNSKKTNKQQQTYKWEITFVGPQIPLQQNTFHKNGKTNAAASQVVVTTLPPPPPTKHQNPNHPIIHHSNLSMTYYCTTINQYIQSYYIQNPTFVKNDSLLSTTTDYDYYPSPFDGFVLFNPGLGHENLKHEWKDAIEYVVRTGRTVLLSAHSDLDAQRDLEVLRELFLLLEEKNGEKRVLGGGGYDVNPFASLLEYDDPYATATTTAAAAAAADTMGEKEGHVVRPNHSVMIIPRADVK